MKYPLHCSHPTCQPPLIGLFAGMLALASVTAAVSARADSLPDFTRLFQENRAAVVNISTTRKVTVGEGMGIPNLPDIPKDSPFYDFFHRFFRELPSPEQKYNATSLGSGFIISSDGYVLTNAHVVDDAKDILVSLSDHRELKAKLIGKDKQGDIALLKVNASNLPTVKIGDSDKLKVGQWVLAIGSPFGFDHSATHGIISAVGRSLPSETYVPFIQTDVALNPGNSGGPLINMDGEVVGINSQIYSNTGGYMGLSFTIPIDMAMNEVEQIKATGHVTRGWLGVSIQDVTQDLARSFGLGRPHGALVASVLPEGPAHAADLKPGDVIVSFAGHAVESASQLPSMVARTTPGQTVSVTVIRQGNEQTFQVKIGQLPAHPSELAAAPGVPSSTGRLGITVADLTQQQLRQLKIPHGVRVEEVNEGPAQDAGIQTGDVIMQIGHTPIESVAQLRQIVARLPAGQPIPLLVQRGDVAIFIPLVIPGG